MIRVPIDEFKTTFVRPEFCNSEYGNVVLRDYKKYLDDQRKDFLYTYWLLKQTFGKDIAYHVMKFHQIPKQPYRGYIWTNANLKLYLHIQALYKDYLYICSIIIFICILCTCAPMEFVALSVLILSIKLHMQYDIMYMITHIYLYHLKSILFSEKSRYGNLDFPEEMIKNPDDDKND